MFHVEQSKNSFDIIVLGGGHAGLEAAWISSQFSALNVAIVTIEGVGLGSAPCNPAVGGVGKGQVVREIDALGGLMGRLADMAGIQYRILNESKGYAVQSTRVQIDKVAYSRNAEEIISKSSITVIRDRVNIVKKEEGCFSLSGDKSKYKSKKLIVTTGTFLNGKLHTGEEVTSGGRVSVESSNGLENLFDGVKTLKKRFKTGTPPRINRNSIDFSKMESQPSDGNTVNFHLLHDSSKRFLNQVDCHLTRTNADCLEIIRANKERSPIFNGQIKGVGPRYCPSIEDKAFRYEDRNVHHVFVEPESLELDTFYPNGISTSLPKEVQEEFLRKIPGLEEAKIDIYGYAVEYDVVDTLQLKKTLEYRDIEGLYFAGQVCGTSGYEEAAGQGIIAGINASLGVLGKNAFSLKRNESYIGVMIEDLVTHERDEPYRLFTARSENRLFIREDNTVQRIAPYRLSLELDSSFDKQLNEYLKEYALLEEICDETSFLPGSKDEKFSTILGISSFKEKIKLSELLQRSDVDPVECLSSFLNYSGISFDKRIIRSVAISIKYRGYIKREEQEASSLTKLESKSLSWEALLENKNLSFECKQRIQKIKPETFGQLRRIEGIRPATLAFVASGIS